MFFSPTQRVFHKHIFNVKKFFIIVLLYQFLSWTAPSCLVLTKEWITIPWIPFSSNCSSSFAAFKAFCHTTLAWCGSTASPVWISFPFLLSDDDSSSLTWTESSFIDSNRAGTSLVFSTIDAFIWSNARTRDSSSSQSASIHIVCKHLVRWEDIKDYNWSVLLNISYLCSDSVSITFLPKNCKVKKSSNSSLVSSLV